MAYQLGIAFTRDELNSQIVSLASDASSLRRFLTDLIQTFEHLPYEDLVTQYPNTVYDERNAAVERKHVALELVAAGSNVNGTAQSTGNAVDKIKLAASTPGSADAFAGAIIKITGGTSSGDYRRISGYNATNKIVTIYSAQADAFHPDDKDFTAIPDATSTYQIYPDAQDFCLLVQAVRAWKRNGEGKGTLPADPFTLKDPSIDVMLKLFKRLRS
jgi:hypothetical protein